MRDIFVGVDVAKAELVVSCRPGGGAWTASNDAGGIAATVARLTSLEPRLIVLEATGGYERAVVAALAAAGLPIVVANPRQVRDFAQATGPLAKTAAWDADGVALFAERVRPTPRPLPDATVHAWEAWITRRRQVLEMGTAERHRFEHAAVSSRRGLTDHLRGSTDGSPMSIVTSIRRSPPALPGARKTTSCRASRVSGPWCDCAGLSVGPLGASDTSCC